MEHARPATLDDLPALVALAHQAIDEQGRLRGGALWSRREARPVPAEASLVDALADPAGLVVVGTFDGTPVGYGVVVVEELRDGGRLARVEDLYVDAGARGVGVGEAMMDRLVAHAEAAGCEGIDALALPGDRETKNFFETFGLKARALVVHRALGAAADGEVDAPTGDRPTPGPPPT